MFYCLFLWILIDIPDALFPKTMRHGNVYKCDKKGLLSISFCCQEGLHDLALSNFLRFAYHLQYLWTILNVMEIEASAYGFASILEWICIPAFLQKSHLG